MVQQPRYGVLEIDLFASDEVVLSAAVEQLHRRFNVERTKAQKREEGHI
jgi:hypothetical protein